jgi:hypothetical protein
MAVSHWMPVTDSRPFALAHRRFATLSALAACFALAYAAATAVGVPGAVLSAVFTMTIAMLPLVGWWAFVRAPRDLRVWSALVAGAATLWLLGSLAWYVEFVKAGNMAPAVDGLWEVAFAAAYALGAAGLYVILRGAISLWNAALDASVVVAAGCALGAAVAGHGLRGGFDTTSLVAVARPLFGVVILVLVASAALGAWNGLPLSILLIGLGQIFLTVGGIVYAFETVQRVDGDFRWSPVALLPGVLASLLAAIAIILRIDRPIRLARPEEIPGHRVGATAVLYGGVCCLTIAVVVAAWGEATARDSVLVVGLAASAWIGAALALRASGSIRDLEHAYERLDRAHVNLERTTDRLATANEELARANVQLRAVHTAFEDLLVIADQRTSGGLRVLIEDAGEDLARLLTRYTHY